MAETEAPSTVCKKCNEPFNPTANLEECVYHPGTRAVDPDAEEWFERYAEGRGPSIKKIDDPEYVDGFRWTCCKKVASREGCQKRKHSTTSAPQIPPAIYISSEDDEPSDDDEESDSEDDSEDNSEDDDSEDSEDSEEDGIGNEEQSSATETDAAEASSPFISETSSKRKAAEMENSAPQPEWAWCVNCEAMFKPEENDEPSDCAYHPGRKKIDQGADEWFKYNPGRGPKKLHVDDPAWANGFKWTCCKRKGGEDGCIGRLHKAREKGREKKTRIV